MYIVSKLSNLPTCTCWSYIYQTLVNNWIEENMDSYQHYTKIEWAISLCNFFLKNDTKLKVRILHG